MIQKKSLCDESILRDFSDSFVEKRYFKNDDIFVTTVVKKMSILQSLHVRVDDVFIQSSNSHLEFVIKRE